MTLEGKVAVVTGAGRGIGLAIARDLARAGANLVLNSATEANAHAAAEAVAGETGRVVRAVAGSVARADVVDALLAEAAALGSLDVLVNNAGITRDGLLVRMKDEDWQAVLDVNLTGAFLCCRAAAKVMMRQKSGSIINVGSVNGIVGAAGQANYSAAKAGLIGLTKAIARELGGRGVRVNLVAPGFIETDMTAGLSEQVRSSVLAQTPLGRLGTPEDVAALVTFLAGEGAGYITGQVIQVDGGLYM